MDPATIDAIVRFLAFAGPQLVGLVAHIENQGQVTTLNLLSGDVAGFQANIQEIDDWYAKHPNAAAAEIQPAASAVSESPEAAANVPAAPPAGGSGE